MAQQNLHSQVLAMLMGVVDPVTLQEATREMTAQRRNPLFLEQLSAVYAGATAGTPPQHVPQVRQIAGAALKGNLYALVQVADAELLRRVQARILATLPDPAMAAVTANLTAGLCSAMQERSLRALEAQWPGLLAALVRVMDDTEAVAGGSLAAAKGALLTIRHLAKDGFLQANASGEEPPAALFIPRLIRWMGCGDAGVGLAAAEAGCAIIAETPDAVVLHLPAYLSALASLRATSAGTHDAPVITSSLLNTFSVLASGAPHAFWPHMPAAMHIVLEVLGAGPEGGQPGRDAGHFVGTLLAAAQKGEADKSDGSSEHGEEGGGGGSGGGGGGSGSSDGAHCAISEPSTASLLPYLEHVLHALLEGIVLSREDLVLIPTSEGGSGAEARAAGGGGSDANEHAAFSGGSGAGEGGGEEEDGDGAESLQGPGLGEDSVRRVFLRVLGSVVEVFPEEGVDIFLRLLSAHLEDASTRGSWTRTEAGLIAFAAVYNACGGVGHGREGAMLDASYKLLLLSLQLCAPAAPPTLRGTSASLLEAQAEWLQQAQAAYNAALVVGGGLTPIPQEQLLAGIPNPQVAALQALAGCLASRDPACVRSAGRAIVRLCGEEDSGTGAAPFINFILEAALAALAAASHDAPQLPPPAPSLSPSAAAALRCELWLVLRDFVNAVWRPLEEMPEFHGARTALAEVLRVTLLRMLSSGTPIDDREASVFLAAAGSFVHPAGECSALFLAPLVRAAVERGGLFLAEHAKWAREEAAQAAREVAEDGGDGEPARASSRPRFDSSELTTALQLAGSAVHTLGAVAGVDREAKGLARLPVCTRAGAEGARGAADSLAPLAELLLHPNGVLLGALHGGLCSDSVTESAHALLGEVVKSRVLCQGQEQALAPVLRHLLLELEHSLGAMGARTTAAQRAAAGGAAPGAAGCGAAYEAEAVGRRGGGAGGGAGGSAGGGTLSAPATLAAATRFCPGQGALGWMVWAAGLFVERMDAGGAVAVGTTLAPILGVLLRGDFEASQALRVRGACALARLCVRGAAQVVLGACNAPGESGAGEGWVERLCGLALGLVVDADRVDAVSGLCALASAAPGQCAAALLMLLQVVEESHVALAPEGLPRGVCAAVAALLKNYKNFMGEEAWEAFRQKMSGSMREALQVVTAGH